MTPADAVQDGVEWMGDLIYHVSTDDGDIITHPICEPSVLAELLDQHEDDEDALAALRERGSSIGDDDAALDLVGYARAALETGRVVEAALTAAVEAARAGDWATVGQELAVASLAERKYGDDPATQAVAVALGEYYPVDIDDEDWMVRVGTDTSEDMYDLSIICADCDDDAAGEPLYAGEEWGGPIPACSMCGGPIVGLTEV